VREADLEHAPLAHDAVEELARRRPVAGVVPLGQRAEGVADRVVGGQGLGEGELVVPTSAVLHLERVEVVVAAPEDGRAQCAHQRQLVGGIVDRLQHDQQVTDLPGAVDQRRGLGPVGDAGGVERVLEVTERGARGQQDAHVAQPAGLRPLAAVRVAAHDRPPLAQGAPHDRSDVGRLQLAQVVGVGGPLVGLGAEQRHRRALGHGGPHRLERDVLGL
jgi:hypothetical protein